mmetsp:Transcript_17872/g.36786  ORF Transcript_17872/g.36786 Transcript_17872/m.36786 type:complete len:109 (-) Transcript_17872:152-478(-)
MITNSCSSFKQQYHGQSFGGQFFLIAFVILLGFPFIFLKTFSSADSNERMQQIEDTAKKQEVLPKNYLLYFHADALLLILLLAGCTAVNLRHVELDTVVMNLCHGNDQ